MCSIQNAMQQLRKPVKFKTHDRSQTVCLKYHINVVFKTHLYKISSFLR